LSIQSRKNIVITGISLELLIAIIILESAC